MAESLNEEEPSGRQSSYEDIKVKAIKKYPLGCGADKELIFCFPFILHKETISYIKSYGRVMFIVRGPPSTGKATLSEMLTERYPEATYCCADRFFANAFGNTKRDRNSLKASHEYCQKKVETACVSDVPLIIVQNTHMRKWEMQVYIDLAASFNYTIIMAITLYRYDCTPQALAENNTDGLDIGYFQNRIRQWEDVLPILTGWFLSPDDSFHILYHTMNSLESLLGDGKFCRVFNFYDADAIRNYFHPRTLLCCLAGYIKNAYLMKKYYLSDEVQTFYGKCFTLKVVGYLVSTSAVLGIVNVNIDMKPLVLESKMSNEKQYSDLSDMMKSLEFQSNLRQHGKTTSFPQKEDLPLKSTIMLEDWGENEEINISSSSFIHLAQTDFNLINIEELQSNFLNALQSVADINGYISSDGYTELERETKMIRLSGDAWLIKVNKKINVKAIFTGLYV